MKTVLITSNEFAKSHWDEVEESFIANGCEVIVNPNKGAMSASQIVQLARQHDIEGILIYSSSDEINSTVFAGCPQLKVVSRHGVGVENIDLNAAKKHGIIVKTTLETTDYETVADFTFGLLLAVARKIPFTDSALRKNLWSRPACSDVWGKTIGIIGLGRIGKTVAKRAKGFSMEITAFDPYADNEYANRENIRLVQLDELLQGSDFVTLHCRLTDDTRCMIGTRELALMKNTAYLINTARAGLVDQDALVAALKSGRIAGAGIDVYLQEPALNDQLIAANLDNLVATPHIGSYTKELLTQMDNLAVQNIIEVLNNTSRVIVLGGDKNN